MITLLLKLIDQQECRAKPTAVTNTEVIRMVENIEEFKELEESLSNKDIFSSFVSIMVYSTHPPFLISVHIKE